MESEITADRNSHGPAACPFRMAIRSDSTRRHMVAVAAVFAWTVALLAGSPPAPAASQGQWLLPAESISASGQDSTMPDLAVGPGGTITAAWARSDGSGFVIQTATRSPGRDFGTPRDVSPSAGRPSVATGPDGATTLVWSRTIGSVSTVEQSTRQPGGSFAPPVRISTAGQNAVDPRIAIGADGTAGIVWRRFDGANDIIEAAIRPPGGSFGAPTTLSGPGQSASDARIAIGRNGETIVVWSRSNGSHTEIQSASSPAGGTFAEPVSLSGAADADLPEIAVGDDGTTIAVWRFFDGANTVVQAAIRSPDGSFGAPVDVSPSGVNAFVPRVAIAPDGTATVVWFVSDLTQSIVQSATRPPDGSFGQAVDLSGELRFSFAPEVAVGGGGTTNVIWRTFVNFNWITRAAARPPGESFGVRVSLSAGGRNAFNQQIATGLDDRAWAVWTRSDGTNDIVQAASTEPSTQSANVVSTGAGTGTVTSDPSGITCGRDCSQDFESLTRVTLTAVPDAGNSFNGWSGACSHNRPTCEMNMDEAKTATADFARLAPVCPPRELRSTKLRRNRKKGTAVLRVLAGGEGKIVLRGSKMVRKSSRNVGRNGRGRLQVRARGKAAGNLKKKGRARFRVELVYRPGGDCPAKTRARKVRLVRR